MLLARSLTQKILADEKPIHRHSIQRPQAAIETPREGKVICLINITTPEYIASLCKHAHRDRIHTRQTTPAVPKARPGGFYLRFALR
jgi:hypothetical protein